MKWIPGVIVLLVMSFALLTRIAEPLAWAACVYDDKGFHCGSYSLGPGCAYDDLGVLHCH